jgi:capsule polysaccharide export protein KpsE/RkpR
MEENKKQPEVIDLRLVIKKIWANKRLFYKTLPIAFVISCVYIFSIPRYYTSEAKIAPEMGNSMEGGTIGSIAASFGFDLSDMQTSDAITPLLYPDLMDDNGFVTSMFNILVRDAEGEIETTYYDYLKNHQKDAWFKYPLHWIKELLPKDADSNEENVAFDPYDLSRADNDIAEAIRGNIKISIDKKTGVITIVTKAQDKLICKTLADSVMSQLQEFIIDYRTNKARNDYEYYKKLVADAKSDYETVRRKYGATSDANMEVTMKSMELLLTDLENDMQLKFNTYTTMCTQLEAAKAKVQDRTPAFTIIEGAAVPVKPAGPKRMIFVIGMMFLTFIGTSFYITKKDFHFSF